MGKKSTRIKELRIKKQLSQEELSENSGISLRTIQRLENGETEAREQTLQKLANALNIDYQDIAVNNESNESINKRVHKYPWLIILAFIIIGGNIGFILASIIIQTETYKGPPDLFGFSLITMFGAIGVVIAKLYVIKK